MKEEEKKAEEELSELTDAEMEQVSGGLGGDSPMLKADEDSSSKLIGHTKWGDIVLKRG
jgi:bacteriocin-like protein